MTSAASYIMQSPYTPLTVAPVQHLDHLLYERLTLNNPHKVWLSIELIRKVLPPMKPSGYLNIYAH